MYKILIIEDTEKIRIELTNFLIRYNYAVSAPSNFDNILETVSIEDPHLILLDINLPVLDGYYICKEIRKVSKVPIIIVTSRDSEMDELMSMNLGADDFITKPYNTQILLARISAVLNRTYSNISTDIINYANMVVNLSKGTIICNSQEIELTKNEFKILHCLLKNKGSIVSRDKLMEYLWTSELFIDDNTLTVNINRLRKKLNNIGVNNAIETRRGLGYIMP